MEATRLTAFSHGAGCACKLGPDELAEIVGPLADHPAYSSPNLVVGIGTADDAGVWQLDSNQRLVQTVDFFTPIVDDPFDWGRIAAANALSDIYAMGGSPITALQIVAWPRNGLAFSTLAEVLRGGAEVMKFSGTTIIGGHSIDDPEPKYGFAVTGLVGIPITNAEARIGDRLVLTKPLGTGIITTAIKHGDCPPDLAARAVRVMVELNAGAVQPMLAVGVNAATDVTGFGLLGHLREMVLASKVEAIIDSEAVPTIGNLRDLLDAGHFSGGSRRNLASVRPFLRAPLPDESTLNILADAQTSGGLLISVDDDRAEALVAALNNGSAETAVVVGEIAAGEPSIAFN
ncbi:MAG: selenide, water dikinase SelD [Acidimicrobiia bacterium]